MFEWNRIVHHFCDGSNMNIPNVNRNYARSTHWMELHMQLCYMQMTAKQCVHACIYRRALMGKMIVRLTFYVDTQRMRAAVRTQIIHTIIIINSELIQWVHKLVHPTGELGIYTWAVSNMNNARPFCVHSSIVSYRHCPYMCTSSQFGNVSLSLVRSSLTPQPHHKSLRTSLTNHSNYLALDNTLIGANRPSKKHA